LSNYIAGENKMIEEHEQIKEILLPLVGKEISKRVLNEKRLGKYEFRIQFGMYYIIGEYIHLIGYVNRENIIAIDKTDYSRGFEYFDASCGSAARERIKDVNSQNKEKMYKIFSQIEKHFNKLRELFGDIEREHFGSFHFPAYYQVLDCIYTKQKDHSDIRLSDFYYLRK
jgi:hypothetical protein